MPDPLIEFALHEFESETPAAFQGVQVRWTPGGTFTVTVNGAPAITIHPEVFNQTDARRLAEGMAAVIPQYLQAVAKNNH